MSPFELDRRLAADSDLVAEERVGWERAVFTTFASVGVSVAGRNRSAAVGCDHR